MKAIILAAGWGSRLLPVTRDVPKCLVTVGGREILALQLAALAHAGVEEAVVVTGYRHAQVEAFAAAQTRLPVRTIYNPFWSVANSIGSVWVARGEIAAPFCLLNGDTVFEGGVIAGALARAPQGIGLVVEPLLATAEDDMLVEVAGDRVLAVAKDLPRADHRSLGVIVGKGDAAPYRAALESVIAEADGQANYHHAVVDRVAHEAGVAAIPRDAGVWQEIDRPEDIAAWTHAHGLFGA